MTMYYILGAVWMLALLSIFNSKKQNISTHDENKFKSKFHNELYQLSFSIPFVWFVEDDDNLTVKGKVVKEDLRNAGYTNKYTVRSFMTFKVLIFLICICLGGITVFIMQNASMLSQVLLNIKTEQQAMSAKDIITVFSFWLTLSLLPNLLLRGKVKKNIVSRNKDIPVLQMFIILMLRANKPITDIIFALSKLNTAHKESFEQGYRIYLRNKREGIDYLKSQFVGSRFFETFNLLEDIGEYAREDCIRILESNMKNIVEETALIKRKNDMSSLVYTQSSMLFPFAVIILLGAVPFVMMGLSLFAKSGLIGF